jgi:hypothetical protein
MDGDSSRKSTPKKVSVDHVSPHIPILMESFTISMGTQAIKHTQNIRLLVSRIGKFFRYSEESYNGIRFQTIATLYGFSLSAAVVLVTPEELLEKQYKSGRCANRGKQ